MHTPHPPKLKLRLIALLPICLFPLWAVPAVAALEKTVSLVIHQPVGELAVAGRLSIDLHAAFMVSRTYDNDTVLNWFNCGYSGGGRATTVGGNFGDFGCQTHWRERAAKYPHATTAENTPAVRFGGGDALKGNFAAEPKVVGAQRMALEVWVRWQSGTILWWQSPDGKETSAPLSFPTQTAGMERWRHLVVNCTPQKQEWWLDGLHLTDAKRSMVIAPGHILMLGGGSFKGELAAVRLHDDAMTAAQIAQNFRGGPMLGTEMHNWWRTEPDKWFVVESQHFRHCVDKAEMAKWTAKQRQEFDERVPGMFHLAELVYHTYTERLALRSSVVSRRPELRGDGIKYKIPIQPTDGGSFMGIDDNFGWACQGAGFINPHELVHGFQSMTGGMQGNYWETHANFPQTYNGVYQTIPLVMAECAAFPSSGRTYYHDRLMFEHLAQTPEYGPMFISKLWYDGPTAAETSPYPWTVFSELNPNPSTPLGTQWTRMVQKMVTWDYTVFAEAKPGEGNTPHGNDGVVRAENLYKKVADENAGEIRRFARVHLEAIPYQPDWWRVPKEQAPQQLGWNICPLQFQPGTVMATLAGYDNPERGSDWRAGFVGVDRSGRPAYGEVFGPGKEPSFRVDSNTKELYLIVCAVPSKIMAIDMVGDFRSFEQEPFPYRVRFTGCSPSVAPLTEPAAVKGSRHPNGGGFVAETALVEPSAFVSHDAQVLGNSKVLGKVRIEDFAEVRDSTVQDTAVVSGHALIADRSVVAGNARVRDYAVVRNASTIRGNARLLEHAVLNSQKTCGDRITIKGVANVYGGNQSGTAMSDGYYAKGNEITKGKWFTWSWGQGKNPGEIDTDFEGLYADYDFTYQHPWMARDAFGATWGYLVNAPKFVRCPERRVGHSVLLKPETVISAFDRDQDGESGYAELLSAYLQPEETGEYRFWISADDEGELWIGNAGSDKGDRKLCANPYYAPYREYKRFPSQRSAQVRLEKGKRYPVNVLHSNADQGGSVSVSWTKSGSNNPTPIPEQCLYIAGVGAKHGVRQRIWGNVAKVSDLIKRSDYPEGVVFGSGSALVLNGKDQFVELPKDIADLRNCSYAITFKWNGGETATRLFEFANPNGDFVCLCPSANGKLVFAIRHGDKTESISAFAIQPGGWNTVEVVLEGKQAALFANGRKVAENNAMTFCPEDVRATQCYLGRGLKGWWFAGTIGRFAVHLR